MLSFGAGLSERKLTRALLSSYGPSKVRIFLGLLYSRGRVAIGHPHQGTVELKLDT